MRKIQFSNIQKKCMCCGKAFPSDFQGTNCTCMAHGHLFAVGSYYQFGTGGR